MPPARTVEDLKKEFEVKKRLGLPVTYVDRAPLPFENYGAIRFSNQMQFHPRKYLLPLAKAVDGDGSYVFEGTRALDIIRRRALYRKDRTGATCMQTTS